MSHISELAVTEAEIRRTSSRPLMQPSTYKVRANGLLAISQRFLSQCLAHLTRRTSLKASLTASALSEVT